MRKNLEGAVIRSKTVFLVIFQPEVDVGDIVESRDIVKRCKIVVFLPILPVTHPKMSGSTSNLA